MAEDKFVWYATLPTLQEMAACAVSRALWYSFISRRKHKRILLVASRSFNVKYDYKKEADEVVEFLKMPPAIENLLKETLTTVRICLWEFAEHFSYGIFESLEQFNLGHGDFGYTKPDFCVWFPDGEIDHQKTAVKMLSLPGFSNIYKFTLMCLYCMEDKILEFPLNLIPKKFRDKVNFLTEPLLDYWINFKKNRVHEMPTGEFTSIEALMAYKLKDFMEYWPAFEYFWHRLTYDEQYVVARLRFTEIALHRYYKGFERIFSLLSASQQRRMLSEIPTDVICKLSVAMNSPRSILWAWMNSKDSLNGTQFSEVVSSLFLKMKEEKIRLLLEVWNTASDQQRNYVAQNVTDEFIKEFHYDYDPPSSAFIFLRQFLTLKDAEFRKQLIFQHAPQFGTSMNDTGTMNDILNLCLPDSEDQSEFKSLVMYSNCMARNCRELIFRQDFNKLDVKLEFFSPDRYYRRKFKRKILKKISFELEEKKKWTRLKRRIDGILSNEPALKRPIKYVRVETVLRRPIDERLTQKDRNIKRLILLIAFIFILFLSCSFSSRYSTNYK